MSAGGTQDGAGVPSGSRQHGGRAGIDGHVCIYVSSACVVNGLATLASASFDNPIELTSDLLAQCDGTLPDGSWVSLVDIAYRIRDGLVQDGSNQLVSVQQMARWGGWYVVHLGSQG